MRISASLGEAVALPERCADPRANSTRFAGPSSDLGKDDWGSVGLCRNGEICLVQDLVLDQLKKVRVKIGLKLVETMRGRLEEIIELL